MRSAIDQALRLGYEVPRFVAVESGIQYTMVAHRVEPLAGRVRGGRWEGESSPGTGPTSERALTRFAADWSRRGVLSMSEQTVEHEIETMLARLSAPLSAEEAADGWTAESKSATKLFFEDLKQKLLRDESLPPLSISRSLDHWGVVGGNLLEAAARISNQLRARQVK